MTECVPDLLFRSGPRDVMERFISEGEIRFRPLDFYRTIEDPNRKDEFEGIRTSEVIGGKIWLQEPGSETWQLGIDQFQGRLNISLNDPDRMHVSCFSHSSEATFGEAKAKIRNPRALFEKMSIAFAEVGVELKWGAVEYYNVQTDPGLPHAHQLWLMKRQIYSPENEFRIGFRLNRKKFLQSVFPARNFEEPKSIPEFLTFRFGSFKEFVEMM